MKKICQLMLALYCLVQSSITMGAPIINGDFSAEIYMQDVPSTDHLAFDSQGNLYTGREDFANEYLQINRISKDLNHTAFGPSIYDPDSVIVDKLGLLSTYGPDSVLVAGLPGQITQISPDGSQSSVLYRFIGKNPQQMVFDSSGRLLYVDCFRNSLNVISGGSPAKLTSFARTTCPAGVAVDPFDNIYVSDYFGDNLIKLSSDGTILEYDFADNFSKPDTLAYDFSGQFGNLLYVASRFAGTIHSIDTETGEKKLFASGFNTVYGLTFGPDNCLYASEMRENTIWKICPKNTELLIDIKPGNQQNIINPNSRGKIPVAILGSDKLDVIDLDLHSTTFGVTGDEKSFSHYAHSTQSDFNEDGHMDIMMYFYTQATGVSHATEKLILKMKNQAGSAMQGSDIIEASGHYKLRNIPENPTQVYSKNPIKIKATEINEETDSTPSSINTRYILANFIPSRTLINSELNDTREQSELNEKSEDADFSNAPDNPEPSYTKENPGNFSNTSNHAEHLIKPTHCKHTGETDHFEHGDMPCPFEYGDKPMHCKHDKQADKLSLVSP